MTIPSSWYHRLNNHGPISFQDYLYGVVQQLRPTIVVETGTRKGIATVLMYKAGAGHIYSCDPIYRSQQQAVEAIGNATGVFLSEDDWTFYGTKSIQALPKIPEKSWDLFVHDSSHDQTTMAWELEYAWTKLRSGGVLVCDDWDTCAHAVKHTAFTDFCKYHKVLYDEIGSAAMVAKP